MALLSKSAILAAQDLPTRDVPMPEWGGDIRIRMLTAGQRQALEDELIHARNDGMTAPPNWRARHLVESAIDEEGKPMFTAAEAAKLSAKSGRAMARIFDAINDLNRADGGAIEAAAGN